MVGHFFKLIYQEPKCELTGSCRSSADIRISKDAADRLASLFVAD